MSVEGKSTNTDILKSKLSAKTTVDSTFLVMLEESLIQEPCENSTEPNSPIKSPVIKSIFDLAAKEGQDSDSDKVETLCKMTNIKTAEIGESFQFFPNAHSDSSETPASESIVVKSSEVTKNKTTEANAQNETSKSASTEAKDSNTEVEITFSIPQVKRSIVSTIILKTRLGALLIHCCLRKTHQRGWRKKEERRILVIGP